MLRLQPGIEGDRHRQGRVCPCGGIDAGQNRITVALKAWTSVSRRHFLLTHVEASGGDTGDRRATNLLEKRKQRHRQNTRQKRSSHRAMKVYCIRLVGSKLPKTCSRAPRRVAMISPVG